MMGDDESELERVNVKACEILHHIARTPSFARVIKKFSVRAYFKMHAGEVALKEALLVMTGVTSFRYEGRCPLPNAAVLDALAQSSGDLLGCHTDRPRLVQATPSADLASSVQSHAVWRCPVRSLLGLQELEIILPPSRDDLELIFHHCTALRYVTRGLFMRENSRFMELLKAHPEALQRLVAFKLFFGHTDLLTREQTAVLAKFLRGRKTLRMLDLADNDINMEEGA
ncbi:hypothetical protein L227DRAFT_612740 [Lentinus tigrinus ALCF2SS1-6]|uniref:F-box domain-containing protein n=1 Tax=Lentinus tigrinus ALCF2SS1-6 TaxID=1328759 RepID=A0A5C2S4V2_9APHY|nr:hypothetical protein L227DRAFT_612740 [Lentinus tigrinus ALCF2SS1-6]